MIMELFKKMDLVNVIMDLQERIVNIVMRHHVMIMELFKKMDLVNVIMVLQEKIVKLNVLQDL